jgi:hypothetical protein
LIREDSDFIGAARPRGDESQGLIYTRLGSIVPNDCIETAEANCKSATRPRKIYSPARRIKSRPLKEPAESC